MKSLLPIVALLVGCTPLSATPPFHLTETTETVDRGGVVVTPAFGGGGMGLAGGVGGGARVRVGVGAHQEVGAEATGFYVGNGTHHAGDPAWQGSSGAVGVKLSYKIAPIDNLAIVVGAGPGYGATGWAMGGDVGLIAARARGIARPYIGAVGTFAIPVGRAIDRDGGMTGGFSIPVGLGLVLSPRLRLYFEAGFLAAWANNRPVQDNFGGYGAVGVGIVLDRKSLNR